MTTMTPYGVLV